MEKNKINEESKNIYGEIQEISEKVSCKGSEVFDIICGSGLDSKIQSITQYYTKRVDTTALIYIITDKFRFNCDFEALNEWYLDELTKLDGLNEPIMEYVVTNLPEQMNNWLKS